MIYLLTLQALRNEEFKLARGPYLDDKGLFLPFAKEAIKRKGEQLLPHDQTAYL